MNLVVCNRSILAFMQAWILVASAVSVLPCMGDRNAEHVLGFVGLFHMDSQLFVIDMETIIIKPANKCSIFQNYTLVFQQQWSLPFSAELWYRPFMFLKNSHQVCRVESKGMNCTTFVR